MSDIACETVLCAARELLSDEAKWHANRGSADARGRQCVPWSMDARRWSLADSIVAVSLDRKLQRRASQLVDDVTHERHDCDAVTWNYLASTTHAAVLAVLDEAIARAASKTRAQPA